MTSLSARKTLSIRRWRGSSKFTAALTFAALEWLLIFLLFVNAVFSYLVTKLARVCGLETPCLLCSRLDHVLGNETPEFYLDLICSDHKLKLSSLVFCHVHEKLADVHGMCEGCLRSFATEKKSNLETYRLLVGTLGTGVAYSEDHDHDHDPLLEDPMLGVSSEKLCSCCNGPLRSKLDMHIMLQSISNESEVAKVDSPLPASVEKSQLHHHEDFEREEVSRDVTFYDIGTNTIEPLSHVGYNKLKITSDSESEVHISDDDDRSSVQDQNNLAEEIKIQKVALGHDTVHPNSILQTHSDDLVPEEPITHTSSSEPSLLVQQGEHVTGELYGLTSAAAAAVAGHSLKDLTTHQIDEKTDFASLPELITLHDLPPSTPVMEVLVEESTENLNVTGTDASYSSELISLNEVPSLANVGEVRVEASAENLNVTGTGASVPADLISLHDDSSFANVKEVLLEASTENSDITGSNVHESANLTGIQETCEVKNTIIVSTGVDVETNQVLNECGPSVTNLMDLSDAYKLVTSNKGDQASYMREQPTKKDSTRVSGDLKLWLSQISSSRGFELSLSDISPRVYGQWEDFKVPDSPSPIGLQILQKRISLERNMSGFESLDGSIVSEIEGESVVERLKRQVEYDRKSMNTLYKELEEERNASAVAANQALAMITRLQEEKAALQTEALQYLRMMEEQAEYDVDALQKANVLLAEKEKEVEDLEAELELYREKFPKKQALMLDLEGRGIRLERSDVNFLEYNINTPCNTPREDLKGKKRTEKTRMMNSNDSTEVVKDSLIGFEAERSYITQRLKKLEQKLHLFSNNGVHFPNGGYSEKEENDVNYSRQYHCEEATQGSSQSEMEGLSMRKDSSVCSPAYENCSSSVVDSQFVNNEKYGSDCEGNDQDTNIAALEHEISDLNGRLKALEADRNFLEHTINSLRTGDGLQFVQEIAHDLHELRQLGLRIEQAL